MKAVIMAGGKGTRLRPLTCELPKPMVPIMNRPIMEHIVELLQHHRFSDVLVTLQYMPEAIQDHFGNGSRFGVRMRYFIEDKPLGTAGSVKNVAQYLDETFVVISGDAMTDIDLTAAVRYHREKGSLATIVLTRVTNPLEYGVVIVEDGGRIERFLEKPSWGEVFSDMVNTGIYVLEPEVLTYFDAGRPFDFSKDLFPMLLEKGDPMFGYVAAGYWCDVGNLDAYRQTHYDILDRKIKIRMAAREVSPGVWVEEDADISKGARLTPPVYIGSHSRIRENAEVGQYSVIGEQVLVEENASLKRSIIWGNVFIGRDAEIRGSTICNRASVKERAAVFEGSVVGTDSSVGARSIVKPGVKIWPDKIVVSGSSVNSSLVWGSTSPSRLFGAFGISGVFNVDLTAEFSAKLGAAYGSGLKDGQAATVSADSSKAAGVIKRAITAGILSSGRDVYDIGTSTTPVTRFAVAGLKTAGGVHIHQSIGDANGLLVEFMDNQGLNLDKDTERRIERDFFGEDFKRTSAGEVGKVQFVTSMVGHYVEALLRSIDVDAVRARGLSVAVECDDREVSSMVRRLLDGLGCSYTSVRQVSPERDVTRPEANADLAIERLAGLSRLVVSSGADMGVSIDPNGERLLLVDENGGVVSNDRFLALLSLLVLRQKAGSTVAVPVTAPHAIERLADEYNGRVVRTKANPRSLMEAVIREKVFIGGDDLPQFQPSFDAMAALGRIAEFISREGDALSSLLKRIPSFYMERESVECPFDRKGEVMRTLIETGRTNPVELLDGVKIFHNTGWALVLPDPDEPVVHVYSEAASMEDAAQLREIYVSKISEIRESLQRP